jgi:hypothetical protein
MSRIKLENLTEKQVKDAVVESVEKVEATELRRQVRARGCAEGAAINDLRWVRG